ncbi:potassium voltage-gated channel protein Shaw-like isoform X2 [Convolutriloba macropyga]|uniref:potassium voltage-gated channel protein Shaw-like isoform X2 n=1 Tax=Convolutriloba macropyga TaxID=536237 RepID=UPI003F51DFE7
MIRRTADPSTGDSYNYPNITDRLVGRHYHRRCVSELPSVDLEGNPIPEPRERVIINIGGVKYHSFRSTLLQVPKTRLFYLMQIPVNRLHPDEYDHATNQYFFDRSPDLFEHIINYYRTGQLHVPRDVCWPLFDNELQFWGLDHSHLETCCWMIYRQHTDNENTLKTLDAEDESDHRDPRIDDPSRSKFQSVMVEIWAAMDDPISSNLAKGIALFSLLTILISVAIFCLETHEAFKNKVERNVTVLDETTNQTIVEVKYDSEPIQAIFYMETCCVIWFSLEFVLRFISCPNKLSFLKKWLNIVDFLSILPYFFDFLSTSNQATGLLRVVRVCRVFRVFKLTRHSVGLKILWHTLHASLKELFILGIFMFLGVVIFASLIYYAEKLFEGDVETDFSDIPRGFWWAIVTMTTLGYGDMVPSTFAGQLIGSLCALSGLLTIALPVPVIVSNFSLYYSHYQAKIKLPKTTLDQMNNKKTKSNQDSDDETQDSSKTPDSKRKGPFKEKTIKNLIPNAGHGSELKLAIGSKHIGYIDPPFDERRERMRTQLGPSSKLSKVSSGIGKENCLSISSEHKAAHSGEGEDSFTDVFDESVGSNSTFYGMGLALQQRQMTNNPDRNCINSNSSNTTLTNSVIPKSRECESISEESETKRYSHDYDLNGDPGETQAWNNARLIDDGANYSNFDETTA